MTKERQDAIAKRLEGCPVSNQAHVRAHWSAVEIRNLQQDWFDEDARLASNDGKPVIFVYPILEGYALDYQDFCILREFGNFLLQKAGAQGAELWSKKLVIPTTDQIDAFQNRLNQGYKNYLEVINSLNTTTDRLVATHLANSMIGNGTPFEDTSDIDIRQWGPTQSLANLNSYYSIIPLTSAYCPSSIHQDFGAAFAAWVLFDLKFVLRTEVATALKSLIARIVALAR